MRSPMVSVLMPSLNVAPYIRQCMESVIGQTLLEIEILCIDLGRRMGLSKYCRNTQEKTPASLCFTQTVKSYGRQINMGLENAAGGNISVVETDDYIAPEMCRRLFEAALSKPGSRKL